MTDNPAAYQGMLGPTRKEPKASSGGAGAGGTAGAPVAGMAQSGTGGVEGGGEGGMSDGGEAGDGRGGTATGTAGTAGGTVNPPEDPNYSPACFLHTTTSGEEIKKGTSCTSADVPLCYRPCGPNQVGWKTEECVAGVYAEGDCLFPPDKDYACYQVPKDILDVDEEACGLTAPPAATDPCTAPLCLSCNFNGFYQDTGSDVKEGYCICREADQTGVRRWTCASDSAWPCPLSRGC
jgi:hypothetical protein